MIHRRDLLKFAGGAAAGAFLSPAPWRLITDTALWSENWPGIPRPVRGEISARLTHCPLCPAGCAMRARCVGGQPISLAGVGGGLCPFGVTAHHLAYNPKRLVTGGDRTEAAAEAVGAAMRSGTVAVLDPRPGRTASAVYRRAMDSVRGTYIAAARPAVSVDLKNARTILSLGAPLLDGWCSPARAFDARGGFRLIQAEPFESRTAAMADVWLPIVPGSEDALVLALAGRLGSGEAAQITGLSEKQIDQAAHDLQDEAPALVIDSRMSTNVVALNIALGGWGRTIFPRSGADRGTELAAVPDRSIRALLIDESLPGEMPAWEEIQTKLNDNAVVVAFSFAPDGVAKHATYALPVPVFPEAAGDLDAPVDSAAPSFRLVNSLVAPPPNLVNPAEFVAKLAGFDAANALRERAGAIHKAGMGTLEGRSTPLKQMTADEFWKALSEGARWTGEIPMSPAPKVEFQPPRRRDLAPLTAMSTERALTDSPLLSKLYRESNLLLGPGRIAMHPADARDCGITSGARIEGHGGARRVDVLLDAGVRRGLVLTAGVEGAAKVVRS